MGAYRKVFDGAMHPITLQKNLNFGIATLKVRVVPDSAILFRGMKTSNLSEYVSLFGTTTQIRYTN